MANETQWTLPTADDLGGVDPITMHELGVLVYLGQRDAEGTGWETIEQIILSPDGDGDYPEGLEGVENVSEGEALTGDLRTAAERIARERLPDVLQARAAEAPGE